MQLTRKQIDFKNHINEEIRKINELSVSDTLYKLTGEVVDSKKEFTCPICGHHSCSILNDRKITCWSNGCLRGSNVYNLLQSYYKKVRGIIDFLEIYKEIDSLLGSKIIISTKEIREKNQRGNFTKEIKIEKYCSEKTSVIVEELRQNKRIIIDAKTGTGKTKLIADVGELLNEVDFVFLLTARRSIVEEIGNEYPYSTFLGNQTTFDIDWSPKYDSNGKCISVVNENNLIVATTHKARAINNELWRLECERRTEPTYAVIIDECHLLHASRNIIGNINQLERLIENSKYTIFTSANTNHFYNASKEQYGINAYINLERKHKINNLDKLNITRLVCNGTAKREFMEGTIIGEIEQGKKVLYINNNKAFNEELNEVINAYGIKSVHINADNKELEEYEGIIKQSVLKANVTICTSVIDTGVNIHTENVTTIISCNNMTFDDISIIQGFARVRTNNGNKGILVLEEGAKSRENSIMRLKPIDYYIKEYQRVTDELCMLFNIHMLDNYDFTSYEEYQSVWNMVKENEMYKGLNDCIKIICDKDFENPRAVIDSVTVYEKSRKHQLRESYFDDKFIGEALADIMTKEVEWNEITVIGEKIEKSNVGGDNEKYIEEVDFILNDKRSLEQLEKHYLYDTKLSETEVFIDLMEIDKERTLQLDKDVKKIIKTCTKTKKGKEFFNYRSVIKLAYEGQKEEKKKDRVKNLNAITYMIYNNIYKEIEYNCENGLGDFLYLSIRETMDVILKNRKKLSEKYYLLCAKEYINKHLEIRGKAVTERTAINRVKSAMEMIYNISEKGYLTLITKID